MNIRFIFFSLVLLFAPHLAANASAAAPAVQADVKKADSLYAAHNYGAALGLYEQALQSAPASSDLHYNIGNCHYRQKQYARSVLAYLRALRFDPANADAAFNLEIVRTKLDDRFEASGSMFFLTWSENFIASRSAKTWGAWAVLALVVTLLTASFYFFGKRVWVRKVGFFGGILLLVVTCTLNVFAYVQQNRFLTERQAVVMKQAKLSSTPTAEAKALRTLHEGTTVKITDTSASSWLLVTLPDGSEGWLQAADVEEVRQ